MPPAKSSPPESFAAACARVRRTFPGAFAESPRVETEKIAPGWVGECLAGSGLAQLAADALGSPGALELWRRLAAECQRRGERVAWLDPVACLDPRSAFPEGAEAVLWVRGRGWEKALEAAEWILRDGNFGLICWDGFLLGRAEWRRIPAPRWYRLQRLAARRGLLLLAGTPPGVVLGAASRRWELPDRRGMDALFGAGEEAPAPEPVPLDRADGGAGSAERAG